MGPVDLGSSTAWGFVAQLDRHLRVEELER